MAHDKSRQAVSGARRGLRLSPAKAGGEIGGSKTVAGGGGIDHGRRKLAGSASFRITSPVGILASSPSALSFG
jgi:hypothetical protein